MGWCQYQDGDRRIGEISDWTIFAHKLCCFGEDVFWQKHRKNCECYPVTLWLSLTLNVMKRVSQFFRNCQLCHLVKLSLFLSLSLSLSLSSCCSCHVSSSFWPIVRKVTLNRAKFLIYDKLPWNYFENLKRDIENPSWRITVFCGPCQTSIPQCI